jgi:hypothetical protein
LAGAPSIEPIQIFNSVKALEQMKMPNYELMKAVEKIINPTPLQQLIEQMKAVEKIINPPRENN